MPQESQREDVVQLVICGYIFVVFPPCFRYFRFMCNTFVHLGRVLATLELAVTPAYLKIVLCTFINNLDWSLDSKMGGRYMETKIVPYTYTRLIQGFGVVLYRLTQRPGSLSLHLYRLPTRTSRA